MFAQFSEQQEFFLRNGKQLHIPHAVYFLIRKRFIDMFTYSLTKFGRAYFPALIIAEEAQLISTCQQVTHIDCSRLFEGADTPFQIQVYQYASPVEDDIFYLFIHVIPNVYGIELFAFQAFDASPYFTNPQDE